MKTSSVNFNAPSPMESKYRRFVLLRKIFEPWQWKRRKREIVFPELQRKISMRSTCYVLKTQCFLWNLPDVEESLSVPSVSYVSDSPLVSMERKKGIRTAADSVQSEWPLWHAAKSQAVFARKRS
ncbi:hypothetical protein TNCV_1628651 [Trichonephila clavipes]|nr:hypothetical protein TNCV_1628651 [Trichonephila clavipes]